METQESMVRCYSGYIYAQRPESFTWQGETHQVSEVLSEAHIPNGTQFLISTPEEECYTLIYEHDQDRWLVRQAGLNETRGGIPY